MLSRLSNKTLYSRFFFNKSRVGQLGDNLYFSYPPFNASINILT